MADPDPQIESDQRSRRRGDSGGSRRRIVVAFTVAGLVIGLVIGSLRDPTYEAEARLAVDSSYTTEVTADSAIPPAGPADAESLAQVANLATSPAVTDLILASADLGLTQGQIVDALEVRPGPDPGVVSLRASSDVPERATALANAAASATQSLINDQRRRRLKRVRAQLEEAATSSSGSELADLAAQQLRVIDALAAPEPVKAQQEAGLPGGSLASGPGQTAIVGGLIGLISSALITGLGRRRSEAEDPDGGRPAHTDPHHEPQTRPATVPAAPSPQRQAAPSSKPRPVPAAAQLPPGPLRPREIAERLPFPVVGAIGDSTLGKAPFIAAAPRPARGADLADLTKLVGSIRTLSTDGLPPSVVVTAGSRDQGASTVAASIAASSALAGSQVLLVDADLGRPSVAERLGLESGPGFSDYLSGAATPAEILTTASVSSPRGDVQTQLVVIPAGDGSGDPAELLADERFEVFISKAGRVYDLIVFDAAPMGAAGGTERLIRPGGLTVVCIYLDDADADAVDGAVRARSAMPGGDTAAVLTGRQS